MRRFVVLVSSGVLGAALACTPFSAEDPTAGSDAASDPETSRTGVVNIKAPATKGTHVLRAAVASELSCDAAITQNVPLGDVAIGELIVD